MGKPTSRRKKAKDRRVAEHYPTQPEVADTILRLIPAPPPGSRMRILDPGAGDGVWGRAVRQVWGEAHTLVGVELRRVERPDGYTTWHSLTDFLVWANGQKPHQFDYIVGNPPYGRWAEKFVRACLRLLKPGGHLIFLLAQEFLSSAGRYFGLFAQTPPYQVFYSVHRLDFTHGGNGADMRVHIAAWWIGAHCETHLAWFNHKPQTAPNHQLELWQGEKHNTMASIQMDDTVLVAEVGTRLTWHLKLGQAVSIAPQALRRSYWAWARYWYETPGTRRVWCVVWPRDPGKAPYPHLFDPQEISPVSEHRDQPKLPVWAAERGNREQARMGGL